MYKIQYRLKENVYDYEGKIKDHEWEDVVQEGKLLTFGDIYQAVDYKNNHYGNVYDKIYVVVKLEKEKK